MLHRFACRRLRRDLRGIGGTLARPLKVVHARAAPGDHIPVWIGNRHNRIIKCRLNMRLPAWNGFALPAARTASRLFLCISHAWQFLPALLLRRSLLAPGDRLSHAAPGARVGAGTLSAHWQITPVAHAPITANF